MFRSPVVFRTTFQERCHDGLRADEPGWRLRDAGCASRKRVARAYHIAGVMRVRNGSWGVKSTCCPQARGIRARVLGRAAVFGAAVRALLAVGLVVLGLRGQTRAQAVVGAPHAVRAGIDAHDATPSAAETLAAYRVVERWVRVWSVPVEAMRAEGDEAEAVRGVPRVVGACVTLRLGGEVIGRGTAWSPGAVGTGVGDRRVLALATAAAMHGAEGRLRLPNDALRDEALLRAGGEAVISVEVAGPLTPIEPLTWKDVDRMLAPGLDGVAALGPVEPANGDGVGAPAEARNMPSMFPSLVLTTGGVPSRSLGSVCAQAIGPGGGGAVLDEPKTVREKHGVRMFRFRTGHAVQTQTGADGEPALLYRGARLAPWNRAMTVADLREMGVRLADHLARRVSRRGGGGGGGDGRIILDASGNTESDGFHAAAATAFLAQALRPEELGFLGAAVLDGRVERALDVARNMLRGWAHESKAGTVLPVEAAAAMRADPVGWGLYSEAMRKGWVQKGEQWGFADSVGPGMRGVFALGYGVLARRGDDQMGRARECVVMVRRAFEDVPAERLVSEMPWLGWAELEIVDIANDMGVERTRGVPSAVALRGMRESAWGNQLSVTDAGPDRQDMIGGIVFTEGVKEGLAPPYPTWQCVRPLAFMATMLRDERLTSKEERGRELIRLIQAMRYLRQLQVDEASAWMYADPERAFGGIRAAVWDESLPVDASSLALMCVVEVLKSLDELTGAGAAEGR